MKLREQYKLITAEYGCSCNFKRTKNCYPSPVLHAIKNSGEDQTAVFRKSPGSGDISGNYEDFETVSEVAVSPYVVTLKGQAGAYRLALWSDGEFAYSLQFSSALPEQDWVDLLVANAVSK